MRGNGEASKTLSKAALLAAGAFGLWGLTPAPEAEAACTVVSGTGTPAAMGPNTDVECVGANTAVPVGSTNTAPRLEVRDNATFDASAVNFSATANNGVVLFGNNASANGSVILVQGANSAMSLTNSDFTNSGAIVMSGDNSSFAAQAGSSIAFTGGAFLQVSGVRFVPRDIRLQRHRRSGLGQRPRDVVRRSGTSGIPDPRHG